MNQLKFTEIEINNMLFSLKDKKYWRKSETSIDPLQLYASKRRMELTKMHIAAALRYGNLDGSMALWDPADTDQIMKNIFNALSRTGQIHALTILIKNTDFNSPEEKELHITPLRSLCRQEVVKFYTI